MSLGPLNQPDEAYEIDDVGFRVDAQGTPESLLAQGNGYIGVRAAFEECYPFQTRGMYVAGTFNQFHSSEVSELPNVADVFALDIRVDGVFLSMLTGAVLEHSRKLDMRTGEIVRTLLWRHPRGDRFGVTFRRFVSLADLHVVGQLLTVTALDGPAEIRIESGIDGRQTNGGVNHFADITYRAIGADSLQVVHETTQSRVRFVVTTHQLVTTRDQKGTPEGVTVPGRPVAERRKIARRYQVRLPTHQTLTLEKLASVFTDRDREASVDGLPISPEGRADEHLPQLRETGYLNALNRSATVWGRDVWDRCGVEIETEEAADCQAVRFAQYHLTSMAPTNDDRVGIGAKGLTGEGYKGHTFWDTELYILPYFTYCRPSIARSLLVYRHRGLPAARRLSAERGYGGAMFPWESGWIEDGDVTPRTADINAETGMPVELLFGPQEHHVTADVAVGVWEYCSTAGDRAFLYDYGLEILFDAAAFWASRVSYNRKRMRYEIRQVIGPDEYKLNVDNNAYTNYTAQWCLRTAANMARALTEGEGLCERGREAAVRLKPMAERSWETWAEIADQLYLPPPDPSGIIPQDDTYLGLPDADIQKYRDAPTRGVILGELSPEAVNELRVSKQADVVMLMMQFGDRFPDEVVRANWEFYEPRTLHDSSLSWSAHCIVACRLGEVERAYEFFTRAREVDLGPQEHSSDEGVHAASLGGIWQCVVIGFGGLGHDAQDRLTISPILPSRWRSLRYAFQWRGRSLRVLANHRSVTILEVGVAGQPIEVVVAGVAHNFSGRLEVPLRPGVHR